jgi:hypothetical protein
MLLVLPRVLVRHQERPSTQEVGRLRLLLVQALPAWLVLGPA